MAGCEDGPNKVCQAGNLLQGLCLQGSFQIFHFKLFKCPADCINNNIIKEGMNICISRTCRLRQSRTSLRRPQTSLSELSACAVGLSSSGAIPPSSSDHNHHHQITITVIISIVIIVIASNHHCHHVPAATWETAAARQLPPLTWWSRKTTAPRRPSNTWGTAGRRRLQRWRWLSAVNFMLILFPWQGGAAQPWLSSATGGEGQPAEERKVKKENLVNVKVRKDR